MNLTREGKIIERTSLFLKHSQKIVDIGCGNGMVTKLLREKGKKVTAVDIQSFKYQRKVSDIILYDGENCHFPITHLTHRY